MKTLTALLTKIIDTPSRHKLRQERMFWAEEKADLTHERNRDMNYQRHLHESSEAEWREQMTELINQHCDERRKWAREKRELTAQLHLISAGGQLCLGEVATGQRRESRQAAVLDKPLAEQFSERGAGGHKDEGYELVATMLDNTYQTLDVVVGSDYESQEEMNAAMQSIQAVHALRLEGQTLRLLWEPLSDD